jgi:sugar lactone lactonase YvrE
MKRGLWFAAFTIAAATVYLFTWPTGLDPDSQAAVPDPGLRGDYALNNRLRSVERLFADQVPTPGGLAIEGGGKQGPLHISTGDGRVLRLMEDGTLKAVGLVGGRPLGFAVSRGRTVVLADPTQGLVGGRKGQHQVLATEAAGRPLRFPVAAAIAYRSGRIYFTDASDTHGLGDTWAEFVERRPRGRLLRYNDLSGASEVMLDGLSFPAGLALADDESFLLVAEATAFRVTRYWLSGDKAGTHDIFLDHLPGYPFALSANGRGGFWLSLYAPRLPLLERLSEQPLLRQLMFRLPRLLQPQPARHAIVLGLDGGGAVRHNLQYAGKDAFAPVTAVVEHDGWLYLASLTQNGIARLRLPQ